MPAHDKMEQLDLFASVARKRRRRRPQEWKIVALREVNASELIKCEEPDAAADYWRLHVETAQSFNPEVECFVVVMLNIKNRIRGHHVVSVGSLNETIAHPREVFRAAVIGAAYSVVLMHNHPSGDPTPSQADLKMTRLLVEAGKTLQISVLDHVIIGYRKHCSLKELGFM